jgi:acetyl esterase/lipase
VVTGRVGAGAPTDAARRRAAALLLAVSVPLALVGCGGSDGATGSTTTSTSSRAATAGTRYRDPVFDDVTVQRDVPYGEHVDPDGTRTPLLMDLYQPAGDKATGRPALVLIHGGGYYEGDKSDLGRAAELYARYGYVVADIDYRLHPDIEDLQKETAGGALSAAQAQTLLAAFDGAVSDSRQAVTFLRDRSAELRIDPARIATMGWSAGGSTSLGHLLQRAETGGGPDVAAAVIASGSIGGPLVDQVAQPPPPALVIAYADDSANSANPPSKLCTLLEASGGVCVLHLRKGSGHEVDLARSAPEIIPFLARYVAPPTG